MNTVEKLWRFQQLEEQVEEIKKQRRTISGGQEIQGYIEEHKSVKKQYEGLKSRLLNAQKDTKRLEGLSEKANSKKEETKEKLYDGKINDLKQLGALLKEQEKMEEEANQIETDLLQAVEELENMEKDVASTYNKERRLGSQIKKMLADRQKSLVDLEQEIEQHMKELEELRAQINSKDLELYGYIKGRKHKPVAKTNELICFGCNMDLPIMTVTQLRRGEITTCDNCGRILYKEG